MIGAVYELDGGRDKYKTMYDAARAICNEEDLNFEDFFPLTPMPGNRDRTIAGLADAEKPKNGRAEPQQCVQVGKCEPEPEITEEPLHWQLTFGKSVHAR
jgi:hypothetical protein